MPSITHSLSHNQTRQGQLASTLNWTCALVPPLYEDPQPSTDREGRATGPSLVVRTAAFVGTSLGLLVQLDLIPPVQLLLLITIASGLYGWFIE